MTDGQAINMAEIQRKAYTGGGDTIVMLAVKQRQ